MKPWEKYQQLEDNEDTPISGPWNKYQAPEGEEVEPDPLEQEVRSNAPVYDGPKGEEVALLPEPTDKMYEGLNAEDAFQLYKAYVRHPRTQKDWTGRTSYNGKPIRAPEQVEKGYDSPLEGVTDFLGGAASGVKEAVSTGLAAGEAAGPVASGVNALANPVGFIASLIPGSQSKQLDETIPDYKSADGPVGDMMVTAGSIASGMLAGDKGASALVKNSGKLVKFGTRLVGSELGGALTLSKDEENFIVGQVGEIPGLQGITIDPEGNYDSNRLKTKLNQIQDAAIVAVAAGGATGAVTKTLGYAGNVLSGIYNWRKLDKAQKFYVRDILEIASGIDDTMSKSEKNAKMAEMAEYIAQHKDVAISFGDPDAKDVKLAQDSISVMIEKLSKDKEANAGIIKQLESLRSSALQGGSPNLTNVLEKPTEVLEDKLGEIKTAKGGDEAINQSGRMFQDQATKEVQQQKDLMYKAQDNLEAEKKTTNHLLKEDEGFRDEVAQAESGGIEFNPKQKLDTLENEMTSNINRGWTDTKKQSEKLFDAVPAQTKADPESFGMIYEDVKDYLPADIQKQIEDSDGNFKTLFKEIRPELSKLTNDLYNSGNGRIADKIARLRDHIGKEQPERLAKSGDPEVKAAVDTAMTDFKENVAPYRQGPLEDMRKLMRKEKTKPAEVAVEQRKTLKGALSDNDQREYTTTIRDFLEKKTGSGKLVDDWMIGSAAADVKKALEGGQEIDSVISTMRESFDKFRSSMSPDNSKRMEGLLTRLQDKKISIKEKTRILDDLTERSKEAEKYVFNEKYKEFFDRGQPKPNQKANFDELFNGQQAGPRIDSMMKAAESDPVLKKGMQSAWASTATKKYFPTGDSEFRQVANLPETFKEYGKKIYNPEAIEGLELLAEKARTGKAANKTRGTGLDTEQMQRAFTTSVNLVTTWLFGVLNPTAARIRTVSGDFAKRYNARDVTKQAADNILSNAELFSTISKEVISDSKAKLTPDQKKLIFRTFVPSVIKNLYGDEVPEDSTEQTKDIFR